MSHPTVCSIHDDNSGLSVKWSVTHQHVIIMDRKIQPLKLTSNKQISRIQRTVGFILLYKWGGQFSNEFGHISTNYDQDPKNVSTFLQCLRYASCDIVPLGLSLSMKGHNPMFMELHGQVI